MDGKIWSRHEKCNKELMIQIEWRQIWYLCFALHIRDKYCQKLLSFFVLIVMRETSSGDNHIGGHLPRSHYIIFHGLCLTIKQRHIVKKNIYLDFISILLERRGLSEWISKYICDIIVTKFYSAKKIPLIYLDLPSNKDENGGILLGQTLSLLK